MNKIVCYVCGTSYPENATQCPICGYVQTAETSASAGSVEGSYTYVKGGRFSKANVKKRNQASVKSAQVPVAVQKKNTKPAKSNVGSIILIIALLLAILSVVAYIALRFFLPNDFLFEGLENLSISVEKQEIEDSAPEATYAPIPDESVEQTEATIPLDCTAVKLDADVIQLKGADSTHQLAVVLEPADTDDTVVFQSSDEAVAVVNEVGLVKAVGDGTAVITVSCGSASAQCTVNCEVTEVVPFELNRKEITFTTEGENWLLYNGDIPLEDIVWTSDDNLVATIESGKVTAVADGDTTVFGVYGDQKIACVIHCKFDEEQEESGEISEAEGDAAKTYMLHNPYGYADDVTMNVGEQFTLKLVDSDMNDADDVQWVVKNESVCTFSSNIVKAVGSGVTEVTATCEGKTYTCVVRVN